MLSVECDLVRAIRLIFGNAGFNILGSSSGGDALRGLGGDDWYFVRAGDPIDDAADSVQASRHWTNMRTVDAAASPVGRSSGDWVSSEWTGTEIGWSFEERQDWGEPNRNAKPGSRARPDAGSAVRHH